MMNPSQCLEALKAILALISVGIQNWDDRKRGITEGKLKDLATLISTAEAIILPHKRAARHIPAFQELLKFLDEDAPLKLKHLEDQLHAVQRSCLRRFFSWLGRTALQHNRLDAGLDEVKATLQSKLDMLKASKEWKPLLDQPCHTTNIPYPLPEVCPVFGERLNDLARFILNPDAHTTQRIIAITTGVRRGGGGGAFWEFTTTYGHCTDLKSVRTALSTDQ